MPHDTGAAMPFFSICHALLMWSVCCCCSPGHSAGVCPCGRHHLGPACSLRPAQQGAVSLWHRAMSTVALGHHEASSQWPATQGMQDAQQQEPHAEDVRSWFPKARTVVWSSAAQAAFPWLAAKNLDQVRGWTSFFSTGCMFLRWERHICSD